MLRRGGFGCLLTLVGLAVAVYTFAVLPTLPWWAVAFGVLFYVALIRRLRAGRADSPATLEDGGTPFPVFRDRGGF